MRKEQAIRSTAGPDREQHLSGVFSCLDFSGSRFSFRKIENAAGVAFFYFKSTTDNIYGSVAFSPPVEKTNQPVVAHLVTFHKNPSEVLLELENQIGRGLKSQKLEDTTMALCRKCFINGTKRDGGGIGVCQRHVKTKCQICGGASLGEPMCVAHTHAADLMRWKAKSQFRVVDPKDQVDDIGLRKERLMESKFLAHQAIDVIFHSLLGTVVTLWGEPQNWTKLLGEEDDAA